MNLKKFKKNFFSETFFRNQKMDITWVMSILRFHFPLSAKKSEKLLMQWNALNGFSKFSFMVTNFFLKNEKK